jgi:hypothetical protein
MQTVCLKKSKQQVNVCPIGSALLVDIRQTLSESLAYSESTLLGNQIRKSDPEMRSLDRITGTRILQYHNIGGVQEATLMTPKEFSRMTDTGEADRNRR